MLLMEWRVHISLPRANCKLLCPLPLLPFVPFPHTPRLCHSSHIVNCVHVFVPTLSFAHFNLFVCCYKYSHIIHDKSVYSLFQAALLWYQKLILIFHYFCILLAISQADEFGCFLTLIRHVHVIVEETIAMMPDAVSHSFPTSKSKKISNSNF